MERSSSSAAPRTRSATASSSAASSRSPAAPDAIDRRDLARRPRSGRGGRALPAVFGALGVATRPADPRHDPAAGQRRAFARPLRDATGDLPDRRQPAPPVVDDRRDAPRRGDPRRFRAGAVVAGTSAGASAMSQPHDRVRRVRRRPPSSGWPQIAAGLGVLPSVIVDQHFQQRNRLGRLLCLIAQNPSLLGLGVDEDTAGRRRAGPRHGGHRPGEHHDRRRRGRGDRRLGGPRPPAADDQRRRPPFAAGRLSLRPRGAGIGSRTRAQALAGRRGRARADPIARHGRPRARDRPPPDGRRTGRRRSAAPTRTGRRGGRADGPRPAAPGPTLRILETRILRGPNYWAREPGRPDARRPGRPRAVPVEHDPGLRRRASSSCCPPSRTTPAPSAGGAASSPACGTARGSGHVAEHIALELQNLAGTRRPPRQDPRRRRRRPLQRRSTSTARRRSGSRPARSPSRSSTTSSTRRPAPPSTSGRARAAHPARRAAGVRAVDPGHPRRGGVAATSRTSGSTGTRSSSSARASTSSGSGRR